MKSLLCAVAFVFGVANFAEAQCCQPRVIQFQCVNPCDVFCGVAGYTYGVGSRVVHGVGQIVTAPFQTPCCIPVRRYIYVPGQFYQVRPSIVPAPKRFKPPVELLPPPPPSPEPEPEPTPARFGPRFNPRNVAVRPYE